MKLKADLFPYPVLYSGLDDYVDSQFYTEIEIIQQSHSWVELIVDFNIRNLEIERYLEEGMFSFAVHLEGVSSSYRRLEVVPISERRIKIPLSSDYISSKIEVNTMILANEKIKRYSNEKFNPDYYDESYVVDLDKGDIIAYDRMAELKIDFDNKENPNAKSMIRVSAKDDNYMSIDVDGDFIQVYLPNQAHKAYVALSQSNEVKKNLLLTTVVQPALMYVIERIQSGDVVDENLSWYIALNKLMEGLGYNEQSIRNTDSLKLAQELLDMPLESSLYQFYEWGDNYDE